MATEGYPAVSVVIPCRNERHYISACLDSLLGSDYPREKLELVVADGMSNDGTREVVAAYAERHPNVKLVDNPRGITPAGMNRGIEQSTGQVVAIVGAHTVFDRSYITECVKHLEIYSADEVGGIAIPMPRENTLFGHAIVASWCHRFGSGADIPHKIGVSEPKWAHTVFSGCFRRSVFERIGYFNEELTHSQDSEFNRRLTAAGGRILIIPHVAVRYVSRSDISSFAKHSFRNGVWATLPLAYTDVLPVRWVHLVPLAFVSALLGSSLLGIWKRPFLWAGVALAGCYVLANLAASIDIAFRKRDWRFSAAMPPVFSILHLGYGFGSLWGLLKALTKPRIWRRAFRLASSEPPLSVADRLDRAG